MSRTIHSHGLRMLALVALLGVARLAAPAATQAQSINPERALLNRTAVASSGALRTDPTPSPAVDGEWALLGRLPTGVTSDPEIASALGDAVPVDGERALLGKIAPSEPRQSALEM
jgi:hypothetical protein